MGFLTALLEVFGLLSRRFVGPKPSRPDIPSMYPVLYLAFIDTSILLFGAMSIVGFRFQSEFQSPPCRKLLPHAQLR